MASIRRTLSPYNERSNFPNGSNGNGSSYAPQSPSHKLFSHGRTSLSPLRRFLASVTFQRQYYRKSSYNNVSSWRRAVFRCSIFFFLGFLLGMAPFSNEDFNELKHPIEMGMVGPPVMSSVVEKSHDDVVVNAVELGVVDRLPTNSIELDDLGIFPKKQLIVVTPTYNRALQAYYLNRLGQVLRLISPPVLWIVVEMNSASVETSEILRNMGVVYRHLVCKKNMTDVKDRGVHQRNTALEHIEKHRLDGIVYFADDDNIYSRELFENMRDISRFGTWPVGMLAQSKNKAILEGPVCNGSRVIGWHTNEKSKRLRRFHVDMSGFAFNSTILWDPKRWHRPTSAPIRQLDTVREGFQETTFIERIVEDESQMEAVPQGCNRIINWHLHLEARGLEYPTGWIFPKNLHAVFPVK